MAVPAPDDGGGDVDAGHRGMIPQRREEVRMDLDGDSLPECRGSKRAGIQFRSALSTRSGGRWRGDCIGTIAPHSAWGAAPGGIVMNANTGDSRPLEEPLARLERELITAYVAGTGEDLATLQQRSDASARQLLAAASLYATARLAEVESRSHYLRSLRGEP
jgi:hypothetical protein